MKKLKRVMCLLLSLCFICSNIGAQNVQAQKVRMNGFSYDTKYCNVQWKKAEYVTVKSKAGKKLGTLTYLVGVARRKKSNEYILMCKEIMTPNKTKVSLGKGWYGYGMSEYVSIKTTLPSLNDYYPTNTPASDSITFSLGFGSDKSATIGASYTVKASQLDITASCNTPKKLYYEKYDYKPSIVNPGASNKYLANESFQLGEAQFKSSAKKVTFSVNYDARFGAAANSACSPWLVHIGYVCKNTGKKTYSFKISK